ncbi:hypothetical protein ILYODFUR_016827 [Ilyodon furcidens]|uniref:Uncharacterized protein n=1 Tax=Ilyodon furcidens TaxID=33524 RepID=A0ABV0UIK7_9TELE
MISYLDLVSFFSEFFLNLFFLHPSCRRKLSDLFQGENAAGVKDICNGPKTERLRLFILHIEDLTQLSVSEGVARIYTSVI